MIQNPRGSEEARGQKWGRHVLASSRSRLLAALLACLISSPAFPNPPKLPAFAPLQFHPPKPERWVMPNGLIVYLLEDHELPLIKLSITIRAGSVYEPAEKIGLSTVFGPAMTNGGSLHHTPEDIRRTLDITGATIDFGIGQEESTGSLSCRADDLGKALPIFADLLINPQFRRDFVNLEKDKLNEALRRMNDEPDDIARREFRKVVYGPTHPYARTPDPVTVDHISRNDLILTHQRYVKPNGSILAISGDFKTAEMKTQLTALFGAWPSKTVFYPAVPAVKPIEQSAIYYVQWPINQSQIRIGHTGMARHDPDHYAWQVFNELWGGSGTSRLFRTVRTQKGLAYAVASTFNEFNDKGLIVAICSTRAPETTEAVKSILEINRDVKTAPFTKNEIYTAREAIRNRFVENFTSSAQIAEEFMTLEFHGYPKDYLDTYTEKIGAIQEPDLKRAAARLLHPDKFVILVVGDLSTFNQPLSRIGPPREIRLPDYRLESQQP
jgi:zinc protease